MTYTSPASNSDPLSDLMIHTRASAASSNGESASSINSSMSGGGGDTGHDLATGHDVKLGNQAGTNVLYIANQEMLCCGIIGGSTGGSGKKLCAQDRVSCTVATHRTNRMTFNWTEPVFCYYSGPRVRPYFLGDPALPVNTYSAGAGQALMKKVLTADDWFEEAAIRRVAAGEDIAPDQLKTAYKEKDVKPHQFGPKPVALSPLALNFGSLSMGETLDKGELVKSEAETCLQTLLLAAKQESAFEQGYSGGDVVNFTKTVPELVQHPFVDTIVDSIDKIRFVAISAFDGVKRLQASTEPSIKGLYTQTKVIQVEMETLRARMANFGINDDPKPAEDIRVTQVLKTLRDTGIEFLQQKGDKVPSVSEIADKVGKEVIKKGTPLYGVISNFNQHITTMMSKVNELSQKVDRGEEKRSMDTQNNPFAGMLGGQPAQHQEGRMDRSSQRQDTVQMDALYQSIEDLREELERVQKQVSGNANVGDMVVSLRGETFSSQGDYTGFVSRNSPSSNGALPPRVVVDVYYLFFLLKKEMFPATTTVRDVSTLFSMNEKGVCELDILSAMAANESGLPSWFHGSVKIISVYTGQDKEKRFKGPCGSYDAWGEPGSIDGIRYKAGKILENISKKLMHEIKSVGVDPNTRAFLEFKLIRSVLFIQTLFEYMTDSFFELQQSFNNKEVTWDFILSCVEHIFTHEFDSARTIMSGHDLHESSYRQKLMWSALRTVGVQEQFLAAGFENHPSLAGAYYKFLLKNSQVREVVQLKKKNADLEDAVKVLEVRIKSAEGTMSRAINAAGGGKAKQPKGGKKKEEDE